MLKEYDCVGTRLLHTMGVNIQQLYTGIMKAMGKEGAISREDFQNNGQRGQGKSSTPMLDQFSRDLTEAAAQGKLDPVVGREQEINRIIQILSRRTKIGRASCRERVMQLEGRG